MRIAREEIFGPVLVVIPYDDEDDAVRIANDSEYGLSGGVWSADEAHALAVARRVRTGSRSTEPRWLSTARSAGPRPVVSAGSTARWASGPAPRYKTITV